MVICLADSGFLAPMHSIYVKQMCNSDPWSWNECTVLLNEPKIVPKLYIFKFTFQI